MLTVQAILSSKAKIALLALAATLPMIVGKIDLNVGFGIVLWHILAITLQVEYGFSWQMAVLTVLVLSALYGLLNGILVALADIDSFVATLGSGTVLYALRCGTPAADKLWAIYRMRSARCTARKSLAFRLAHSMCWAWRWRYGWSPSIRRWEDACMPWAVIPSRHASTASPLISTSLDPLSPPASLPASAAC